MIKNIQKKKIIDNSFQWWKILILFIFIFTACSLIIKLIFFHKIRKVISVFKGGIFHPIYSFFLNQDWPIISETKVDSNKTTKILNIAYPDTSITYYVSSFSSNDNVCLTGKIPSKNEMFFWSLTIYEENGSVLESINDADLNNNSYSIIISPSKIKKINNTNSHSIYIKSPENSITYSVIQRVYKKNLKFDLIPDFVPKIIINNGLKKIKDIDYNTRINNSNILQSIFHYLFTIKFKKINIDTFFKSVDVNQFFLPSDKSLSLVFPNPYAKYLMVFPKNDKCIKVEGSLQDNIGSQNNNCRYISFMSSNFYTTSTDNSISYTDLKKNKDKSYILFVAKSLSDATDKGYNKDTENHNLLLWKEDNEKPVLVYRIVSTSTKHNNDDSIFLLNNQFKNIAFDEISKQYIYAPKVAAS